jgi:hypothetical protein
VPTLAGVPATIHHHDGFHSGNSISALPSARRRGARWHGTPPASASPLPFVLRAQGVFSDHRLQHILVQTQIRYQLLQPRVLIAQMLDLFRFAHIHVAVLRLPGIDRVFETPYSRATSSTVRPASTCFGAAIICASVCLLLLITHPFVQIVFPSGRIGGVRSSPNGFWIGCVDEMIKDVG